MPEQIVRNLPSEFIEALGKTYGTALTDAYGKPTDTSAYAPQVAPESLLQAEARGLAPGLGGYAPYITGAASAADPATAYQTYMSPYQQDIIDTTMQEYDLQSQKGLPALRAQAIGAGAFGGGRRFRALKAFGLAEPLLYLYQARVQRDHFGSLERAALRRQDVGATAPVGKSISVEWVELCTRFEGRDDTRHGQRRQIRRADECPTVVERADKVVMLNAARLRILRVHAHHPIVIAVHEHPVVLDVINRTVLAVAAGMEAVPRVG